METRVNDTLDHLIERLLKVEGGYSNNPDDAGGETNHGVTETVARENGYTGDMKDMPLQFAVQVYKNTYWIEPKYDRVHKISPSIAYEMFDTGVNCGTSFATRSLIEALNLMNRSQKDYKDIKVPEQIGNDAIASLEAYIKKRGKQGEHVMVKLLNILQGARYVAICQKREANETFLYGWLANRIGD